MSLYCGIDLHSNNHVVVIIDENDNIVVSKKLNNHLGLTLELLAKFKDDLIGVAVESTFNWYWLVDGLIEHGYTLHLVNTAAVKQYEGLKYTNDTYDSFWLAHLLRLGILPTGYIYPKEQRAVRDLLRRRMQLVRMRSGLLISLQSQVWRSTGQRMGTQRLRSKELTLPASASYLEISAQEQHYSLLALTQSIERLEKQAASILKNDPAFQCLQTIKGVGSILGMTILLETGDINRFSDVGNYSSYCRCVKSEKLSNGKRKGEGNTKNGNRYLSWAFSEAAHFAIQWDQLAKRFYQRKKQKTNGVIAMRAVAHKLARATYYILRDHVPYQSELLFR